MRYCLRTLLIALTFAGLTFGGWSLSLNAATRGRVHMAQPLVLLACWAAAILVIVPRK